MNLSPASGGNPLSPVDGLARPTVGPARVVCPIPGTYLVSSEGPSFVGTLEWRPRQGVYRLHDGDRELGDYGLGAVGASIAAGQWTPIHGQKAR